MRREEGGKERGGEEGGGGGERGESNCYTYTLVLERRT